MRWRLEGYKKLPKAVRLALDRETAIDSKRPDPLGVRWQPLGGKEMLVPEFWPELLPVVGLWVAVPRDWHGNPLQSEVEVLLDRRHIFGAWRRTVYYLLDVLRSEELRRIEKEKKERDRAGKRP